MGMAFGAIAEYFAADSVGAVAVDATAATAAGSAMGAGMSSLGTGMLNAAVGGLASAAVGSMLAPKMPKAPSPAAAVRMPDPLATQQATEKSLAEQLARRGRASTILTSPGGDKLGG